MHEIKQIIQSISNLKAIRCDEGGLDLVKKTEFPYAPGIVELRVSGGLRKGMSLEACIAETGADSRIDLVKICKSLDGLPPFQIIPQTGRPESEVWVRLKLASHEEGVFADRVFISTIKKLEEAAVIIQENVEYAVSTNESIQKLYEGNTHIHPVLPLQGKLLDESRDSKLAGKIKKLTEWIISGYSLELVVGGNLSQNFIVSWIAANLLEFDRSIGELVSFPQFFEKLSIPDILFINFCRHKTEKRPIENILSGLRQTRICVSDKPSQFPSSQSIVESFKSGIVPADLLIEYGVQIHAGSISGISLTEHRNICSKISESLRKYGQVNEDAILALVKRNLNLLRHPQKERYSSDLEFLFTNHP